MNTRTALHYENRVAKLKAKSEFVNANLINKAQRYLNKLTQK